jgi:hypothetical protein
VINACGPLQDDFVSQHDPGAGDVFQRWLGMFDGLRTLLGAADIIGVNADVPGAWWNLAESGEPLIASWFRANRELRGSGELENPLWFGALFARRDAEDPVTDRLPRGAERTAVPLKDRTAMIAMWTPVW